MPQAQNVLFIMVDQLRHDWLGYRGADWLKTPNLDKLAEKSRVFTQCCTTAPTCAPARVSLATGLNPMRFSTWANHSYLPLSRPTYYQRLRDHGYRVGGIGKFDLAKNDGYNGVSGQRPLTYAWGFTDPLECEGKMHAGRTRENGEPLGPYGAYLQKKGLHKTFHEDMQRRVALGNKGAAAWPSPLPTEDFEDVFIGRSACEWLERQDHDFPWHLFVSFVGPHNPFDAPEEYAAQYRDKPMPSVVPEARDSKPSHFKYVASTDEEILAAQRQYAAAITLLDDQIGNILAALEQRGEADNTTIIFTSDHGEMLGDHGRWTKGVHYEASLRVPLLIYGADIEPGVCDDPVELHDLNPTICDVLGVAPAPQLDARSLAPVLDDASLSHREDTFAVTPSALALRTRTHKLIFSNVGFHELYDLQADPDEQVNIAEQEPELLQALIARMHARHLDGGCLR